MLNFKLSQITKFADTTYPQEVDNAFDEFFADIDLETLSQDVIESTSPLFSEWLMFEYRLPSGRTMVLEYFARNSQNLTPVAYSELEQIIKSQRFDLLQITDWKPDHWVNATGIYSGIDYTIKDISLSRNLSSKGCIYGRLAQVNGDWIMIGSNPLFLSMEYTLRAQKMMRQAQKSISAKEILPLYLPPKQSQNKSLSNKQIQVKRKSVSLKYQSLVIKHKLKCNFDKLISFVYTENYQTNFADWFSDLNIKLKIPQKVFMTNLDLFQDCWNFFPHKNLDGKAPIELYSSMIDLQRLDPRHRNMVRKRHPRF